MLIVGALSIHAHITNHCTFSSLISASLLLQSQPDTPSFVNSPLSFHHLISVHLTSNHTDSESYIMAYSSVDHMPNFLALPNLLHSNKSFIHLCQPISESFIRLT